MKNANVYPINRHSLHYNKNDKMRIIPSRLYVLGFFCLITACHAPKKPTRKLIGLANPAAVYCEQINGQLIPMHNSEGEYSNCLLPNGQIIEEWTLYRKTHMNNNNVQHHNFEN